VPLSEGGPAPFVGVSHSGNANTRIAGGKVGIQLPTVACAYDQEGNLAGHVDPFWLASFGSETMFRGIYSWVRSPGIFHIVSEPEPMFR
jgi:hypothetical protein